MTAALFLAAPSAVARCRVGDVLTLAGDEGRHAVGSKRVQPGEAIDVGDGRGTVLRTSVSAVTGRDSLEAAVVAVDHVPEPAPRLVVVQALPKGDRAELAVEMLTEVGVDVIVPWSAHRCVTRWTGERAARGPARWQAVARSAGKQSRRAWLPQVAPLAGGADVVRLVRDAERAVVLHEAGDDSLGEMAWPLAGTILLVVGPEGGITEEEIEAFATAGASTGRMGPTVMRTSTAGAVAAGVVLSATARWARPGARR